MARSPHEGCKDASDRLRRSPNVRVWSVVRMMILGSIRRG